MLEGLVVAAALLAAPKPTAEPCRNELVQTVREAGWRGNDQRIAWAVAMRESNGQAGESSYPDLGLFQLNATTWQGSKYWPNDPLNGKQNAKAAHRMWKDMGWRPWGLNSDGTTNASDYSMWSQWQIDNWITIPFQRYYKQYPGCKPAKP